MATRTMVEDRTADPMFGPNHHRDRFRYSYQGYASVRVILPPSVKDTSLCSLIAAPELMLRAKDLAMMSFLPMHLFVLAAGIYFVLAWPMSLLGQYLELRMRRGYRVG